MSETNGEQNFEQMLAGAVEAKLGNLIQQNQCAMDVFIALLARQRAAGVNDPVIHISKEERMSLMGQQVSFTSYPDGSLSIYAPGSGHAPPDTEDWNNRVAMPAQVVIVPEEDEHLVPEDVPVLNKDDLSV